MSNRTVPAAAEGMPSSTPSLDQMLMEFVEAGRQVTRASYAYDRAYDSLPAWAQRGPRLQFGDGRYGDEISGWPEVEDVPEPSGTSVIHVIRPSIEEVWKSRTGLLAPLTSRFLMEAEDTPEARERNRERRENRRAVRCKAFAAVRKVIARRRQQKAEKLKVDLPAAVAAQDLAWDVREQVAGRIRASLTGSTSAELAADALLHFREISFGPMCDAEWETAWVRKALLARLLPHLTGFLRFIVHDLVHGDANRIVEHTLLCGGEPGGAEALDIVASAFVEGIAA